MARNPKEPELKAQTISSRLRILVGHDDTRLVSPCHLAMFNPLDHRHGGIGRVSKAWRVYY